MNIILFDDNEVRRHLLPLTYTRPTALLRVGITTIEEKWKSMLGAEHTFSYLTASHLKAKFPLVAQPSNLMVAGHVVPTPALTQQVLSLASGEALVSDGELIAFNGTAQAWDAKQYARTIDAVEHPIAITRPYHIFLNNATVIEQDYARLTQGRTSCPLPHTCTVIGDSGRIFLEPGATVDGAFLNTRGGSIYVGADVEIMEGACVRGPFAACHNAKVRMGARVYGGTTLGPHCKVGGELENVIMTGYSNKAHDGFLGDAVIGEWCNLGGGTSASNLKNDYSEIKLWDYAEQHFRRTGLQFCGLIMGDHSKTGVNCMINTATVLGVGVNIHGSGFPRPFVASFHEGSSNAGFKKVPLKTFYDIAERVMARRSIQLTQVDRDILASIYNISDRYK